MNQDQISPRECISALVDGQLGGGAFARAMDAFGESEDGAATWHAYHVIGDALRSRDLGACQRDGVFLDRVRTRMAEIDLEPPLAPAPAPQATPSGRLALVPGVAMSRERGSANDAGWRWKLVALAASVAAVSVIVWQVVPGGAGASATLAGGAPSASTQFSTAMMSPDPAAVMPEEPLVMLRDPRLDEMLVAHKQSGGMSALQMPAGFLRNATFDTPGR